MLHRPWHGFKSRHFDKGGEGLAYHVGTPGNPGGLYRQEGVPIVASTDLGGGYAVSGLKPGDWLAYTIDAGKGGWFAITTRVLPGSGESLLSLLQNRRRVLTSVELPGQSANQPAWTNVQGKSTFYLPPGEQIVTVRLERGQFQLANFTFATARPSP